MTNPYRVEEPVPETRAELVYVPRDSEDVGPMRRAMQVGIGGSAAGVAAAAAGFPLVGAAVLGLSAVLGVWRYRRTPTVGIALVVERGDLVVTDRSADRRLAEVRLVNLVDVALDTKNIRKVIPGNDSLPAAQFTSTSVGPELQIARIVLHFDDDRAPVPLGEPYVPHMDAVEGVGKIRSFLRQNGWVPGDEREAAPASSS